MQGRQKEMAQTACERRMTMDEYIEKNKAIKELYEVYDYEFVCGDTEVHGNADMLNKV